jgi:hypothetical protein
MQAESSPTLRWRIKRLGELRKKLMTLKHPESGTLQRKMITGAIAQHEQALLENGIDPPGLGIEKSSDPDDDWDRGRGSVRVRGRGRGRVMEQRGRGGRAYPKSVIGGVKWAIPDDDLSESEVDFLTETETETEDEEDVRRAGPAPVPKPDATWEDEDGSNEFGRRQRLRIGSSDAKSDSSDSSGSSDEEAEFTGEPVFVGATKAKLDQRAREKDDDRANLRKVLYEADRNLHKHIFSLSNADFDRYVMHLADLQRVGDVGPGRITRGRLGRSMREVGGGGGASAK